MKNEKVEYLLLIDEATAKKIIKFCDKAEELAIEANRFSEFWQDIKDIKFPLWSTLKRNAKLKSKATWAAKRKARNN